MLAIAAHISCHLSFIQAKPNYEFDYVFFEMAPYIYYKNGTIDGAIVKMYDRFNKICNLRMNLKYNVKTMKNMTDILQNSTKYKQYLNNKAHWLLLTYSISDEILQKTSLKDLEFHSVRGIEVVMHRRQIDLLKKIFAAIIDCRHIISLALILNVCFGILIWIAVSEFQVLSYFSKCDF